MSDFQDVFKRKEVKYLLSYEQYKDLRNFLKGYAEVDGYGETDILNIYYDTEKFDVIQTSLDKPLYKEKLRLRSYGTASEDSKSFIEIKKKFDGIVYKRRISAPYKTAVDYLNGEKEALLDRSQIRREIDSFLEMYPGIAPKMAICYKRIAMAGVEDPKLRITFDKDITWRTKDLSLKKGNYGREILEKGQHLMEVKIGNAFPIELSKMFSELGIFPISFSKYGRGYLEMIGIEREEEMVKEYEKEKSFIYSERRERLKRGGACYA